MSDDDDTPTPGIPSNGTGPHGTSVGAQVARQLYQLISELADNRRAQIVQETRMVGLARVIQQGIPFGSEQADQVADVIQEAGDLDHSRGSIMYDRAAAVRRAAKG